MHNPHTVARLQRLGAVFIHDFGAVPDNSTVIFVTRTTPCADDAPALAAMLRSRFPEITGPRKEDVCHAATTRRRVVKSIATSADIVIIVDSQRGDRGRPGAIMPACKRQP